MNEQKKQRLVGSIVLLALAVIVIPMIFDFSRQGALTVGEVEVPPPPEVEQMKVLPLDLWSQREEVEVDTTPIVVGEAPGTEQEKEAPAVREEAAASGAASSPQPAAEGPSAPEPEEEKPAAAAPLPRPDVADPAVAKGPDPALKGKAWIVQIGSFSSREKALVLRDRLRDKGYTTYVEPGTDDRGRRFYRVRIGPELLHSRAERLRQRLKRDTGLDGLVMRYR